MAVPERGWHRGPVSSETPMSRGVLAAVLGQTVISAGTHLAAKQATTLFAPATLITLRLIFAALVFAAVLAVMPGPKLPPRRTWAWLLGFALVSGPLNQGLFLFGLARSRATHGGLLYALTPIGVYLLGIALKREQPRLGRLVGIALALAGVVVLLLGRGLDAAAGPLIGDLFILGAVVAWVVWTTESRPFAAEHGGVRTAAWSIIAGGLWMLPAAPFVVRLDELRAIPPLGWWCLAYLVLLTSVVSYALWNFALARVSASRVAVFANLQPLATALAAWVVLDEPLGWEVAVGGLLVMLGVRLAQR
jgi:drug/metabolite transporter (DMT)-like permease